MKIKNMRIEMQGDLTEQDVEDFCLWIGLKAEHLGFKVSCRDEDREMGENRGSVCGSGRAGKGNSNNGRCEEVVCPEKTDLQTDA